VKKLLLVLCLVLTTVLFLPSVAGASTPTLKSLAKTVAALQKEVASQSNTIATLTSKLSADEVTIAAQGQKLSDAASLLAIAPYVSLNTSAINGVAGPNIVFQGSNVWVRSSTSEEDTTGTGNLIVGWDSHLSGIPSGYRTGSNNLVCGDHNGFTGYGGFVAGRYNKVSGAYASISGGTSNTASGDCASVSGGLGNFAIGSCASVSGGEHNDAEGGGSSVSGGDSNLAMGYETSVSGGYGNQPRNTSAGSYSYASISGGYRLTSNTIYGWAGGTYHTP